MAPQTAKRDEVTQDFLGITPGRESVDVALAAISGQIEPGHTVQVGEVAIEVVDDAMSALGGTVERRPAADVYDEIQYEDAVRQVEEHLRGAGYNDPTQDHRNRRR